MRSGFIYRKTFKLKYFCYLVRFTFTFLNISLNPHKSNMGTSKNSRVTGYSNENLNFVCVTSFVALLQKKKSVLIKQELWKLKCLLIN